MVERLAIEVFMTVESRLVRKMTVYACFLLQISPPDKGPARRINFGIFRKAYPNSFAWSV
jgi:hypothetical protein